MGVNRNKRSIVLDLKTAPAREAMLRLVDQADVFVHNIRPQKLEPLGLGSDLLCRRNPRLIYAGIHGWREDGLYRGRPAYDDIIQAGSGLASLQTVVAGQPRFLPTIVADKTSSNGVVSALLAALFARERTGKGQAVEVPMFETLVSFVMVEHLYGETFMPALDTAGYKRVLNKERRPYPSKDGFFALLPYTDGHWKEFCGLVGRPDLAGDARFTSLANRLKNVEYYYATLAEICATRTNAEWVELLKTSNVPHGPVNTLDDLFVDPQLMATGFWKEVDHPTEGKLRMPDIPPRFSKTKPEVTRLQPRLGEHSVEILREAGFTAAEIDAMLKSGATKTA